ncbi:MAG: TolC family protein, partial [Planctomycetaceae bacterium]
MRRLLRRWLLLIFPATACVAGCAGTDELGYFGDDGGSDYYKDVAQTIDYPDVESYGATEARRTAPPRTVLMIEKGKVRNLGLKDAIHLALANNRIIRSRIQFQQGGSSLVSNPNVGSVYEPAIQETNVLFGGRGTEAALSEFDATFSTSLLWGRSEDIQNNLFFGAGTTPGNTLQQDTAAFRSALTKRFADGGTFLVGHDWNYRGAILPGQLFSSTYTGNLRAEYRRPLLAGSGVEFTRIAGATNPNFGAITGVSQGVVIARINNDISLADFEANVRNLVKDVEDLYWDLHFQYRRYKAVVVARDAAQRTWSVAKTKRDIGVRNFNPQDEPQARDQYYAAKAEVETVLNTLYTTEIQLRRLMGLAVNDETLENGGIIRPSDEPQQAKLVPDWEDCLTEALTRRLELRRQKWNIKSLQL